MNEPRSNTDITIMNQTNNRNSYKHQDSNRSRVYTGTAGGADMQATQLNSNRDKFTDRMVMSGKAKSTQVQTLIGNNRGNAINVVRSNNNSINQISNNSTMNVQDLSKKKSTSQYVNINNVHVVDQQAKFRSSQKMGEGEGYPKSPYIRNGTKQ